MAGSVAGIQLRMSDGNGQTQLPLETYERFPYLVVQPSSGTHRRRPLWPALLLLFLTVISTLAVGAEFARSYAADEEPFSQDPNTFATIFAPFRHPQLLLQGIPFSFTLLLILGAHELGHYFTCKHYGIEASYPYFIPFPNIFGTFGAFIRIRSPITTRRALFDVGISGPVVGFVLAVPAMAFAIAHSKVVPGIQADAPILFGNPPLMRFFMALFHPGVDPNSVLLHPIGRAAWVGLFATALNLLPLWQLDGGHIVYSLAGAQHRRISLVLSALLIVLGKFSWPGWYFWGGLMFVLSLRFRHPPLMDRWESLGSARKLWALAALAIFVLCFTAWPAIING
jgi:membrane-associated protease RseP (regulator of RpoE activity)